LPAGVYFLVTTRAVSERAQLARRPHLFWYDPDAEERAAEDLRDGTEYVARELASCGLAEESRAEIARLGAGNFLVLQLLCQHVRLAGAAGSAADFLRRLATDGRADRLGFIYEEFWQRLTGRLARPERQLLYEVAGLLVTAEAPLTADMIGHILHLRSADWDFALEHLAEYLTILHPGPEESPEPVYRLYHESFADFVRGRLALDQARIQQLLAEYWRAWQRLPDGYARHYAVRHGPRHL
jgi:hypothetical protein